MINSSSCLPVFSSCQCVTAAVWERNKQKQNRMDQPLETTHTPNTLTLTQPFASLWEKAADRFFEGFSRGIDWVATTQVPQRRLLTIWIFLLFPSPVSASIGCLQQRGTRRSGASFIIPGVEQVRPCTGSVLPSYDGGEVRSDHYDRPNQHRCLFGTLFPRTSQVRKWVWIAVWSIPSILWWVMLDSESVKRSRVLWVELPEPSLQTASAHQPAKTKVWKVAVKTKPPWRLFTLITGNHRFG